MWEMIADLSHWHWLTLGLLLLALELLGTAGYMLWLGISALIVGFIRYLLPLDWFTQWIIFVLFALLTTWLWWRYQHSKDKEQDSQQFLNQRSHQLIGKTAFLTEDLKNQRGRLALDNSNWTITAPEDYPKGTKVKVTAMNGIILEVEKVQ